MKFFKKNIYIDPDDIDNNLVKEVVRLLRSKYPPRLKGYRIVIGYSDCHGAYVYADVFKEGGKDCIETIVHDMDEKIGERYSEDQIAKIISDGVYVFMRTIVGDMTEKVGEHA